MIFFCFILLQALAVSPVHAKKGGMNRSTEVPYRMISGKLIVPVEVGGKVRHFLFDTGASRCCISESLSRELGARLLLRRKVTDSGGRSMNNKEVLVESMRLGDWQFSGIRSVVLSDNNPFFECYGLDGIIGSSLLNGHTVLISARDSVIVLGADLRKEGILNKPFVKMSVDNNLPFIMLSAWNGEAKVRHRILIDTGARDYSCNGIRDFIRLQEEGVVIAVNEGIGQGAYGIHGIESVAIQRKGVIPRMVVGEAVFENVPVSSTQGKSSLLGTFLLDYGDMVLDYKKRRFYYLPFQTDLKMADPVVSPLSPAFVDGELVVGVIWDESLRSVISPGDRILFVDDREGGEFRLCDVWTRKERFKKGMMLRIESTQGGIVDVEL